MQQIENPAQNKKAPNLERFSICNSKMVRQVDSRWNQVYPSLYLLQEKLANFGLVVLNDKVVYEDDLQGRND